MNTADWITAGKITAEIREWAKGITKKGASALDIAEQIEAKIHARGAVPAFPVNISINDIAAHYTPIVHDPLLFEDQLVKVDIGVCYNGAIGDTAFTVDFSGQYTEMIHAAEDALKQALNIAQIGTTLGEIGKVIHDTIVSYGYSPVKNLSGHGLDVFEIHTTPSVPNYDTRDKTPLEKGQIIAIEPFATDGKGMIRESGNAMIFSELAKKPIRDQTARKVFAAVEKYTHLPFATRWLCRSLGISENQTNFSLRLLKQNQNVVAYPPLVEEAKGWVTQAEHTLLIDDTVKVLTR